MAEEAKVFMVKYIEIAGSDPAKVVAACESLGIKAPEAGAGIAVAAIDTEAETPAKKRGRGRPPKPKDEEAEEAPKRRRGRPPKKRDEEDSKDEGDPPPKRRRGRPPKKKEEEDPPKRRRGRPPKKKEEDDSPKRRAAEPPDDDGDEADEAPTYADIAKHLKKSDPRRIGDIVEELYLEFGWEKARDMAQVLKSVRADTKLEETDFWAVLERICPDGEDDDWLDLLEEKVAPHLEAAIGAAEDAENG